MVFIDNAAKTNWKFIGIVAVLASMVGAGVWMYQDEDSFLRQSVLQQDESDSGEESMEKEEQSAPPPAPSPVVVPQVQTHRDVIAGFEVDYPTAWSTTINTDGFMLKIKNPPGDAYFGVAKAGGHGIPGKWTDALTGSKEFEGIIPGYTTTEDFLIITYGVASRTQELQKIFSTFRELP